MTGTSGTRRRVRTTEDTGAVEPRRHDLAFVGAGASTAYVLLGLIDAVLAAPPPAPLTVCVVERAPDPFTGIPYGGRAARTSLLITALRDFLPEGERALFMAWLAENKHWVFDEFLASGGPLSAQWWARHEADIRDDRFEALFLPRYTFGEYLARRTRAAIERAESAGAVCVEVVRDTVLAVEPEDDGYLLRGQEQTVQAGRVVLATGSAPVLPRLSAAPGQTTAALIDDPFDDMPGALARIQAAVASAPEDRAPHVLMIGANAGTMDMLYQINDSAGVSGRHTRFTVVSPSGRLPERVDDDYRPRPFLPEHLEALERDGDLDAASVYRAALDDIMLGRDAGLSVADTLTPISQAMVRLVRRLSPPQAAEFADRWGVELGRHQRRAGWEYCEVVDQLADEDRLELVAGAFVDVVHDDDQRVRVRYEADGVLRQMEEPVDAVVNCGGPGRSLEHTSPPLLTQLVASGLCRLTPSGGGIAVDPSLAAAQALHVMGPLLAGNLVKGAPVWHMEHCGRISAFGVELGSDLAGTLVPSAG